MQSNLVQKKNLMESSVLNVMKKSSRCSSWGFHRQNIMKGMALRHPTLWETSMVHYEGSYRQNIQHEWYQLHQAKEQTVETSAELCSMRYKRPLWCSNVIYASFALKRRLVRLAWKESHITSLLQTCWILHHILKCCNSSNWMQVLKHQGPDSCIATYPSSFKLHHGLRWFCS